MKTLDLNCYLDSIQARKAELERVGAFPDADVCRNSGARRNAGKRAALKRADTRAIAAGIAPVSANY
ncbi:hypothetical protein EB810_14800 [Altererythrobacter sp. FM1]|uniref:Uncharacterized protein n=1 Tax=Tsuneonella flava TaxID=2055955 RepID=A0ABX7KD75_9SPHN|nr:hypothetical protein [Tsuneonella flava]QSB45917.1 hypothetical protein IDJ81_07555 [Tsuneonella flava]ROT93361.1 hypothetical protein EB810_14800 [Altererythrobacter sp. FM1]